MVENVTEEWVLGMQRFRCFVYLEKARLGAELPCVFSRSNLLTSSGIPFNGLHLVFLVGVNVSCFKMSNLETR